VLLKQFIGQFIHFHTNLFAGDGRSYNTTCMHLHYWLIINNT